MRPFAIFGGHSFSSLCDLCALCGQMLCSLRGRVFREVSSFLGQILIGNTGDRLGGQEPQMDTDERRLEGAESRAHAQGGYKSCLLPECSPRAKSHKVFTISDLQRFLALVARFSSSTCAGHWPIRLQTIRIIRPGQILTGNIGNIFGLKLVATGNRKHLAFATRCSSTV